jgi:DNA segregation ATPase FtsK/SpoIIIE, S-DNA-T family
MAGRSSKTNTTRKNTPTKSSSGSAKTAAKKGSKDKRPPPAQKKKPTSHDSPARTGTVPGGKKSRRSQPARPSRPGLSLDRKLDLVGVGLALVGVLTLLSLLSPIHGSLTGAWVTLIGKGFGWGMYLLPLGMVIGGLWLVLRNFQHVPQFAIERVLGVILLFVWFLAATHFILRLGTQKDPYSLASQGEGGGYLGAFTAQLLETTLGQVGAVIALIALLLIAIVMSFDLSIYEILDWFASGFRWLRAQVTLLWKALTSRKSQGVGTTLDPEFTPLHRTLAESLSRQVEDPEFKPLSTGSARQWVLPPINQILDRGEDLVQDIEDDRLRGKIIEETLKSFGAPVRVTEINRGPTITQYGVEPDFVESRTGKMRVRVSKIVSLADDLALALSARTVRIQAPVPGKGYVGIEVPNEHITPVMLRDVLESEAFGRIKSPLRFAIGKSVAGNSIAYDLATMPHLLIAGATGSGKSVCVNALICSLLMFNTPDELRLIMVDPKRVELSGYNGIPHLLAPVVVDLEKVVAVLQWVAREMDMRYRKLSEAGARNIQEYNSHAPPDKRIPYLVTFIDELADLMMLAPDETERTITRLAQMSRATGIHLVIATQRPSVDVVTGMIKANLPARIAFAVVSNTDSRVILDQPGAELLLGRGDMLFMAPDAAAPVRLQGVFVSDSEIFQLVSYWQAFAGTAATATTANAAPVGAIPGDVPLRQMSMWEEIEEYNEDPLLKEAIDLARRQGRASISMLQRRLRIGYTRAARLVERMEEKGIVGPPEPSTGTREILDYGDAAPPVDERRG